MPRGGAKKVHATLKIKDGVVLFTHQGIIIQENIQQRMATPTEANLALAAAKYKSLWHKLKNKRAKQQPAKPDYYYAMLAALVQISDAITTRRYDQALAIAKNTAQMLKEQ